MGGLNKMKHSKMFKILLAGVAVVALASTTFAALSVPLSDDFESYSEGDNIGTNNGATGWYSDVGVATATTSNNPTGYYAGYPITNYTHNVTMAFDGTVSNSIAGVAEEDVYVDFLVQPVRLDTEPKDGLDNVQLAMYFDTNGYANVYHGYMSTAAETTNLWTLINTLDPVATGAWVRVTYKMDYAQSATIGYTFFNLYINGSLVTNKFAYPDASSNWTMGIPATTNGAYFLNADALDGGGSTKINSFTAKGSGTLDDFVVTNGDHTPFVAPWTVTTTAGAGGSITAGGLVNEGDTFSATVTADMNKLIEAITTNSVAITLTNSSVQVVDFAVYSDVTVAATFTNATMIYYTIAITNLNDTLGSVVPGTDTNVVVGTDLDVIATPNTGYVAEYTVDGSSAIDGSLIDIQENHVVLVDFALGYVPSTNGVDISSQWLLDYGLDFTLVNADLYWEAYLADINPTNGSSFEIISAEVVGGTNIIKWISEGKTPTNLPPFDVLGTDDLTNNVWTTIELVARPSTYTTNEVIDATKTYYKLNATD